MSLVIISRHFSGLHETIKTRHFPATGIPAFVNLAKIASHNYNTTWIIVCKTEIESNIIDNKRTSFFIDNIKFIILPYKRFLPNITGVNQILNDLIAFSYLLKTRVGESKNSVIYSDRSSIMIAFLIKRILKLPVVIRILGVYPDQKKIANSKFYKITHPVKYFAYKTNYDMAIGTQDGSGIEYIMDSLLNSATKKYILLNGVDNSPRVVNAVKNNIKLLYVGTLSESKGIIELLHSVTVLAQQYNNFTLSIVGKGPLFDYCIDYVNSNNLRNIVRILGAVETNQLARIYKQSDVYVSVNKLGNLSNTVLEAASHGLCMILLGFGSSGPSF